MIRCYKRYTNWKINVLFRVGSLQNVPIHLLFVVVVSLFVDGSLQDDKVLINILEMYNEAMGMDTNLHKYYVYFNRFHEAQEILLDLIVPYNILIFSKSFKYSSFLLNPYDSGK